jgi:hypothetical protein
MINEKDLSIAKNMRLQKLISALEDQDKLLEYIVDRMPMSDERNDLIKIEDKLIIFLNEVDGMLSV